MEFGVDQRRKTVEGGLIAVSPSLQEDTDFLRVGGRHKKLSQNIVVVHRVFRLPD
jgi:hypothetical protein